MRLRSGAIGSLLAATLLLPRLAWALCAPEVSGVFPASGEVGTVVAATVRGFGLMGATVSVFGEPGLDAAPTSSSDTALNVQLTIAAGAPLGERILVIETAGGIAGASFTVNPVGGLIVADVSPIPVAFRGFGLDLTLTGQRLDAVGATGVSVSGTGVGVASVVPSLDGTSANLSLDVAPDAELGARAIELTSSVGGAILQMVVQRPGPTIDAISPGAVEIGVVDVPLVITGENLTGAAVIVTSGQSGVGGVTLGDVVTVDDGMLTTTVSVDAGLTPEAEPRLLIVTTESGQATTELFIVPAGVPTVTTIAPGAVEPGEIVNITIRGLNLSSTTAIIPDVPALVAGTLTVVDDETLMVDVENVGAALGDHVLTLDSGPTVVLRVIPAGVPFIGRLSPPFGNRGSVVDFRIVGVNLGGVIPGTGVDLSGPKIIESNAEALDDMTVRALLDLDPTASVGFRDVTVTTGGGSATLDAAFRVNVPGQVPIITDVAPILVEPGVSTTITVTGSGFEGGSVLVTGPGASVTNVQVDPTGTTMTFDLVIDAEAPATQRAVIVVTENGTARCGIGVVVGGPVVVPAKLVKTGARFTVASTGFRFLIFEFSISPEFPEGLRTVVVTSPDDTELVLGRRDVERIRGACRDRHRTWVRATGVTATNLFGTSDGVSIRR